MTTTTITTKRATVRDADINERLGLVSAVFSTFNTVDLDGDYTLPGAIPAGSCIVSAYAHKSWSGDLPVGVGDISSTMTEAIVKARFFMTTTGGADTFEVVRELGAAGLQEWSYSLEGIVSKRQDIGGRSVNVITSMKRVREVSPVLAGAGIGTRVVDAKTASREELDQAELLAIYEARVAGPRRDAEAAIVEMAKRHHAATREALRAESARAAQILGRSS